MYLLLFNKKKKKKKWTCALLCLLFGSCLAFREITACTHATLPLQYALCLTLDLGPGSHAREPHPLAVWENSVYFNIYTPCNCMAGSMKVLCCFLLDFCILKPWGCLIQQGSESQRERWGRKLEMALVTLIPRPGLLRYLAKNTGVPSLFCINQLGTQIKHPVSF